MSFWIFISFLIFKCYFQSKNIKIPFEVITEQKEWDSSNIFNKLGSNLISVEFSFGEEKKKYKFNLDSNIFYSYVVSPNSMIDDPNIQKFTCDNSTSCDIQSLHYEIKDTNIDSGDTAKSNFSLEGDLNKNSEIKINDYRFIYPDNIKNTSGIIANSGKIGLGYSKDNYTDLLDDDGFIHKLKKSELIEKECFFLEYTSESKGNLIIGQLPYEYDSSKYKKDNFVSTHIYPKSENTEYINWSFSLNRYYYGKIKPKTGNFIIKTVFIQIGFGMIQAPKSANDFLYENFFQKKIEENKCEKKTDDSFIYYSCIKDFGINEMNSLYFVNDVSEQTFELKPNNLFKEFNQTMLFLIRFEVKSHKSNYEHWIFGEPFLNKHILSFSKENKGEIFIKDTEILEPGEKPKPKKRSKWDFVVFGVICAVVSIILIVAFYKTCKDSGDSKGEILEDNLDNDE